MSKQHELSVEGGLKLATHHPSQCGALLAKYLYPVLEKEDWFTSELRVKFCIYFLENLIDRSVEEAVDKNYMVRLRKLPLPAALRLMRRDSVNGLKILVALISQTLREEQKLSTEEQHRFYDEMFGRFFPACQLDKQRAS